jgi:hypothetical protein
MTPTAPTRLALLALLAACAAPPAIESDGGGEDVVDGDADGFTLVVDCDDENSAVHPNAEERANDVDDDCDSEVDEGTRWGDDDGDGWSERDGDCDDDDGDVSPTSLEAPNGVDDNCDGVIDNGTSSYDDDGDGYTEQSGDCDDGSSAIHPGATEASDGRDQDCDGVVDEGTSPVDADGDGWSVSDGDCNDDDGDVNPLAWDVSNGQDDDCDGDLDEDDIDGDGWAWIDDCDDDDAQVNVGAVEVANAIDDDCDGLIDEGTASTDADGDGWSVSDGDCDDTDPDVNPWAWDIANGIDDDCDFEYDEDDADADGWHWLDDCDDNDPDVNPWAWDIANGVDDDCDGELDEDATDATFCGLEITCPSAISTTIGRAGQAWREWWDFQWQYSSECGVAVAGPFFATATTDLTSAAFVVETADMDAHIGFLRNGSNVVVNGTSPSAYPTIVLPHSPSTVPQAGCTVVVPVADATSAGQSAKLHMNSRRHATGNSYILNFVVVNGSSFTQTDISQTWIRTADMLAPLGINIDRTYAWAVDTGDGPTIYFGSTAEARVRAALGGNPRIDSRELNIYFVDQYLDSEPGFVLLGAAGGVPGPIGTPGTTGSGVIVAIDPRRSTGWLSAGEIDHAAIAQTIAHELGHQLGLRHTTERDGSAHDPLSDTPECSIAFNIDGTDSEGHVLLSAEECADQDGRFVMFWEGSSAVSQTTWSYQQRDVLLASPAIVE